MRADHSAPVVAVVTYVKAGYFDETDDVTGIAHVLEHMYFKGTPTRGVGEIAKQTKASGGYLNAATIYDHTRYYAVLPAPGFDRGLEIQADAYANSLIDSDELARELEVIIQEASRKADSPDAVTTETLFEVLHDQHRIRRWRIGREPGLRRFTRDHVSRFYRTFYQPASTILSIVGDVDPVHALRRVEALYGGLSSLVPERIPGPAETGLGGRRYRHLSGDVTQVHAALGWRTPGAGHADTPFLDLAATMLGTGRASRLYRAVREKGLGTSVAAWNYTPPELGVFVVQLQAESRVAPAGLGATWREVTRFLDGVSHTDVTRAQRLFEARELRRLETMEGQANYLADWEALGSWEGGAAYAAVIAEAGPADIRRVAERHLDPRQAALLVYEPTAATPWATDATDAFAQLDAYGAASGPPDPMATLPFVPPAVVHPMVRQHIVDGMHVYRTAGDVPILVKRRKGAPIVHLGVYAAGGASQEPASLAGVGTLLTRVALKGTARRDAATIALQSELLGGGISATTTSDGLGWSVSVPTRAFAEAVDLLADVVLQPALEAAPLETERVAARAQLAQLRDDMYRYPVRLATEAAYGAHPYARGSLGTDEGLAGVVPGDLQAWHARQVHHGTLVVAMVGDIDEGEAAAVLGSAFAAMRWRDAETLPPPGWAGNGVMSVEQRDKAQTALCMAFPGPRRADPMRHAAQLLAVIASGLGGRFFDELRERQSLAYTVHFSPTTRAAAGMQLAYIATAPEKEDAARQGLLGEFARLRELPVTDEELIRAQTFALGTHSIAQQNSGHVLAEMVDAWLFGRGLEELAAEEAALRAVTPATILALAQRYFDPAQRVEGVVRGRVQAKA